MKMSLLQLDGLFFRFRFSLMMAKKILSSTPYGSIQLTTPENEVFAFHGTSPGPKASVKVKNWSSLTRIMSRGDIGIGEAYMEGEIDFDSVSDFIQWGCLNHEALRQYIYGRKFSLWTDRLKHMFRSNSKKQSRENIKAHYDLGNSFYELWLDPTKSYSSGLFLNEQMDLESAQVAKYARVLQQIQVRPKDHVLEIGCGWGGFLTHLMEKSEAKYTGLTLSTEQLKYCQDLIKKNNWQDRAQVLLQDYRDEKNLYDHVVSIEMVEAVGREYWPIYIETVSKCLRPSGQGLIQGITINEQYFKEYCEGTDFIQQYIFPGGMLLSMDEFGGLMQKFNLQISDQFGMGKSYAKTLHLWSEEVARQKQKILKLGFDEKFYRMWQFYLGYCAGAFLAERTDVLQISFTKKEGQSSADKS